MMISFGITVGQSKEGFIILQVDRILYINFCWLKRLVKCKHIERLLTHSCKRLGTVIIY